MAQGSRSWSRPTVRLTRFEARTKLYDSLGVLSTYALAKGPPAAGGPSARGARPGLPATDDRHFLDDPEVVLATRTFGYMRLIALASGVLALIGLVLYLQARQRSQVIAAALGAPHGLRPAAQTLSLALELVCLLDFAGLIGGTVAVAAAIPVVHRIDPLPVDPPSPIFVIPTGELALAAAALLLVVAVAAASLTSWLATRTDVGEALRVA